MEALHDATMSIGVLFYFQPPERPYLIFILLLEEAKGKKNNSTITSLQLAMQRKNYDH
jgi:hypothetical protein